MRVLALTLLWVAGMYGSISACVLGVLLWRAFRIWYHERRLERAFRKLHPDPQIQIVKKEIYARGGKPASVGHGDLAHRK